MCQGHLTLETQNLLRGEEGIKEKKGCHLNCAPNPPPSNTTYFSCRIGPGWWARWNHEKAMIDKTNPTNKNQQKIPIKTTHR
jgi:hypothetical protein